MIKGKAAHGIGKKLKDYEYEDEVGDSEVRIDIDYCGICHSDIHLIDNDWGMTSYPFIPGHEIVGKVAEVGDEVSNLKVGDVVGVGWQCDSCGDCKWCRNNDENLCDENQPTCVGRNGGFADGIVVNERFAIKIPEGLTPEETAPLFCGGITVYSPLAEHGPFDKVGVVGIGGLGHLAVKFASAMGAEVTAFSTSPEKEEEALAMGADKFVTDVSEVEGELDFIINTAPADLDYGAYMNALAPYGKFCQVGAAPKPIEVNAFSLIRGKKAVVGSNIGSPKRIREMLDLSADKGVGADVEVFDLEDVNEALKNVRKGKVHYRAVLKL